MADLWLPGTGYVPSYIRNAMKALEEYDPDLSLARDGDQWVIMLNRGPEGRGFPVLGLGFDLPAPEEIKRRLHQGDTRRRGREIVAEVDRHNEARKKSLRGAVRDGAEEFADALSTAYHIKKVHATPRIFVPSSGKDT